MSVQKLLLKIIVIFAMLFCYGATASFIAGNLKDKSAKAKKDGEIIAFKDYNNLNKLGLLLFSIGTLFNFTAVLSNWIINGYVPFISMYQVMTFVSLMFPLTYLYMRYVKKLDWTIACFSLCSAVFLTGVTAMNHQLIWHQPPALQSVFFIPHVMAYMLSYSLCAVAFVLNIMLIALKFKKVETLVGIDENRTKRCESAIYKLTITAFPFMVLGMLLGALWANECWGTFWGWDPKENWSLITMSLYAIYFHTRKVSTLKRFNNVILIAAFIALIITFVGVSLLYSVGNHAYT